MADFATAADVAIRLGRTLTNEEEAMAGQVIEAITALIADAADRDAAWAEALDPVPRLFKLLCIEKVIAVGANPSGLASRQKTIGAVSRSETFRRGEPSNGLLLTEGETTLVRELVLGQLSGTAQVQTILSDPCVICGLLPSAGCGCSDAEDEEE